jgi:FPC/CPF motif-containing protein YcgG
MTGKNMETHKLNEDSFKKFIIDEDHPCIMSQTIFSTKNYQLRAYDGLGSQTAAKKILEDLKNYLEAYDFSTNEFFSFIAVFEDESHYSEIEFEKLLWDQLQNLHNIDHKNWDSSVSSNPKNKSFSFSILGTAFYIVGMHPNSSRNARKSPRPTLVFNLHWQFEKLRKMGVYERVRDTIRKRDVIKNGSVNPMLVDFGSRSEAPQYSGREVGDSWECPFKHKVDK